LINRLRLAALLEAAERVLQLGRRPDLAAGFQIMAVLLCWFKELIYVLPCIARWRTGSFRGFPGSRSRARQSTIAGLGELDRSEHETPAAERQRSGNATIRLGAP